MSSKRKFADFDGDAPKYHSNKSRDRQYNPGYNPTNRKPKSTRDDGAKAGSLNWLKKRARTIERRFKAGHNLPANVQNDMERELAHHKQKIAELSDDKHRKSMISKYHMVRFFERKKADRLAKQIRKQLSDVTDEEETKRLKADLHTAEIDSIYCRYFPHREPYVSLYPVASAHGKEKAEDASTAAKALRSERPPMWRTIEEAVSKGEKALVEIRERKPAGNRNEKGVEESPSQEPFAGKANHSRKNGISTPASAGSQPSKAKQKAQARDSLGGALGPRHDDDESDGGFFEDD
ncbi:rRNA-processing protein efg1 [Diatrype stigma]|uniref:rRNA-processing protein EFG1 n=1 Tax=Diatrype stigma TaxID=117547 RepID=A0AAN9ULL6_9PEZI